MVRPVSFVLELELTLQLKCTMRLQNMGDPLAGVDPTTFLSGPSRG